MYVQPNHKAKPFYAQPSLNGRPTSLGYFATAVEAAVAYARFLAKEIYIKANDPHFDAKLFPTAHPRGTGSLHAEVGSGGGIQNMARNRLAQPQSWFRRNPLWNIWMLDRFNKTMLYFRQWQRKNTGMEDASK